MSADKKFFRIEVSETRIHTYHVEAISEREAERMYERGDTAGALTDIETAEHTWAAFEETEEATNEG